VPLQDQTVRPLADLLLACLATAVAELEFPPYETCLRPGSVVEPQLSLTDDECCRGLAWVRADGEYASDRFPEPNSTPTNCGPQGWAVPLEMGIVRCAPTPGAADLTSCAENTELAYRIMDDGAAMRRAICCFAVADPGRLYVTGPHQQLPIAGRCAGSTMLVTIHTGDCDCGVLEAAS
jgi:hypothetical protein